MIATSTRDPQFEEYLSRLDRALAGVPAPQKEEIVLEIRSHLYDSLAQASGRDAPGAVLRGLGDPAELAERYRTEFVLASAARSYSPLLLLRGSWHWAMSGFKGIAVFFIGLIGYGSALVMTISVFLKPFLRNEVGLWVGRGTIEIGTPGDVEGLHEVLGQWFIPVITVTAFVVAVATTQALRGLLRNRSSRTSWR